jgi:L,D-transpeptidase ErfK/SrfK
MRLSLAVLVVAALFGLASPPAVAGQRPERQVVTHFFRTGAGLANLYSVVGTSRSYRIIGDETFVELARRFDLGFNELVDANPALDPWEPGPGHELLLPSEWVLPRGSYEGLVVNIPEMRLYYYLPSPRASGRSSMVVTYPVGLGHKRWDEAKPEFTVTAKTLDPVWTADGGRLFGRLSRRIAGGHSDNPLGSHLLELSLSGYSIHGTNKDWGVGMRVSHGSVRMYPEDIEALFSLLPVGSPGRFVYQPVKVGMRRGRVVVEVHDDIYGVAPWPWLLATQAVEEMSLGRYVDPERLRAAVEAASGVPTDVSYVDWPRLDTSEKVGFNQRGNPLRPYPKPQD